MKPRLTAPTAPAGPLLPTATRPVARVPRLTRWARGALLAKLTGLRYGTLLVREGADTHTFGAAAGPSPDLRVTLTVRDPSFYPDAVLGGSIGAGEAYIRGAWEADDLTGLIRLFVLNAEVLSAVDSGWGRVLMPLQKLYHWQRRNTHAGSRRNIVAHYDLGNDFFALFLDRTMMYSSAIFPRGDETLEAAAIAKVDRICRKLELQPAHHLLEIGSGWGALAVHAATHYGCRVTTTTISDEQYARTVERVRAAGLADRITVLHEDYRQLTGTYDRLVSVEMIEAVGCQFYDTYFAACSRLLTRDGLMLLQAITIADQQYLAATRSVDFIQRYIFPGSNIPAVSVMTDAMRRCTDLRLIHLEDFAAHYAHTLQSWRANLFAHLDQVRALGCTDEFIRLWEFYLCYCEGSFSERAIGVSQLLFAKPWNRRAPVLGELG